MNSREVTHLIKAQFSSILMSSVEVVKMEKVERQDLAKFHFCGAGSSSSSTSVSQVVTNIKIIANLPYKPDGNPKAFLSVS
jgi:hypothetical protein